MQIVSLIDWILTMILAAAVWQMYEVIQPHSHGQGKAEAPQTPLSAGAARGDLLAGRLQRIREAGGFRDLDDFVLGARRAYEAVVNAYGAGDTTPVAGLLAPEIGAAFEDAIAGRIARGETLTMIFIGLAAAEPVDAGLENGQYWISVRFRAQRVSATADREGKIIEGHPHRVDEVAEVWTFARPQGSHDPNWVLVATGGQE